MLLSNLLHLEDRKAHRSQTWKDSLARQNFMFGRGSILGFPSGHLHIRASD